MNPLNPIHSISRKRVALMLLVAALLPGTLHADALKDGRNALQAGRLDDALKLFEQAAGEGLAEGRAGVGLVWLKRRQPAKAMEAFQTAQKMDPNLAVAYYGQGEVFRFQEKCDQAAPLLQRAVELDRKYPEAQLSLADCLTKLKRFDEASAAANRGLGWGSKWRPKFLVALGDVAWARDSLREAGIWYTKAMQEAPTDPFTRRALGDFYVRRGTFELAYPEYQAAVAMDSTDLELRYALGRALYFGERYNQALDEFSWVVARDPDFAPGQYSLGDLLYRAGKADRRRYAEARVPLERYVQLAPEDPKGWSVLGRTLYHAGEREAALAAMNRADSLGDKTKELFLLRARLWTQMREPAKALDDYTRAGSELADEDQLRLAQLLMVTNSAARAESLYRAMIDEDSTSRSAAFAYGELGKIRFRAKQYEEAIPLFQKRIALDPANDEAYYYTGLSYKEMKRYPEAVEALSKAATGTGEAKPDRHLWLGILYQQTSKFEEAKREYRRAIELDSTDTANKALAQRQLGFLQLVDKEYSEAIRVLEESGRINPKDVQTLVWLAQSYQNSGNRAKAMQNYNRALEVDPSNAEALKGKKILAGGPKQGGTP